MEELEENSLLKAISLIKIYSSQFLYMTFTMHAEGVTGEARGKSSNVSHAAREMREQFRCHVERIVVTVMDGCFFFDLELKMDC